MTRPVDDEARRAVDRRVRKLLDGVGCFCRVDERTADGEPSQPLAAAAKRPFCLKHWLLDRLDPEEMAEQVRLALAEAE